jgi:hypothetical protein
MGSDHLGKLLLVIGRVVVQVGLLLLVFGRVPFLGNLPGISSSGRAASPSIFP